MTACSPLFLSRVVQMAEEVDEEDATAFGPVQDASRRSARLLEAFASSKANCAKHAPVLVAACIIRLTKGQLVSLSVKKELYKGILHACFAFFESRGLTPAFPGLYSVLNLIDERERDFLYATLPAYGRSEFKKLYQDYETTFKFKGRV